MTFPGTSRLFTCLLAAVLAGGAVSAGPPELEAPPRKLFTLVDYFESGRRAVQEFVREQKTDRKLAEVIRRTRRSCVRIEIRHHLEDDGFQSVMASGVVLEGGRLLLTAGHSLDEGSDTEVLVTLVSGETRRARVLDQMYQVYGGASNDWALLEIIGPRLDSIPPVRVGKVREGELAIILGYPDQIGVDSEGRVAYATLEEGGYLEPLETLGVVGRSQPLMVKPQVGAIPMGGMSGGPVFDHRGGLIGIFVSLRREAGVKNSTFLYNAAAVSGLLERLQEHADAGESREHAFPTSW